MEKLIYFISILLISSLCFADGDIQLSIEGIKPKKGTLKLALVKNPKLFPNDKNIAQAFRVDEIKANKNSIYYSFKNIPYGTYAISIYHDQNDNDQLDMDIFGVPLESFGFSTNPTPKKRSPTFEESKFQLKTKKLSLKIKMIH